MIECSFEDGGKTTLRHVVNDGLIVRDNMILLVKRAEWLREAGKYCLPGGYMERNETTVAAVIREAQEETGWQCSVDHLFAIVDAPDRGEDRQNVGFIYILQPLAEIGSPDHETAALQWFPFNALPSREEIAFDHWRIIQEFISYRSHEVSLPIILS